MKAMKAILISVLIVLMSAIFSDAKPIRDIISVKEPAVESEDYINDIPFNTRLVASSNMLFQDGWEVNDEAYVDDIPFDTRSIANEALLKKMTGANEEAEIDDIPFDTRRIAAELLIASLTEDYRNENEICDIPYETVCIISTSIDNRPAYVVVKMRSPKKAAQKRHAGTGYEYSIIQSRNKAYSPPVPTINTLTRDLMATPGSSL